LPTTLGEALEHLSHNTVLNQGLSTDFVRYYQRIKQSEQLRFNAAEDKVDFARREYFSRI
jgi:glutamine synthetase